MRRKVFNKSTFDITACSEIRTQAQAAAGISGHGPALAAVSTREHERACEQGLTSEAISVSSTLCALKVIAPTIMRAFSFFLARMNLARAASRTAFLACERVESLAATLPTARTIPAQRTKKGLSDSLVEASTCS